MSPRRPFLIGVSGGTASGKTTVCRSIMERLADETAQKHVSSICQDSFYRNLNEAELARAKTGSFNFDHPDAFDNELMLRSLGDLLQGNSCQIPEYDYTKHAGMIVTTTMKSIVGIIINSCIAKMYQKQK